MKLIGIALGMIMWAAGLMVIYADFIFAPLAWHSADGLNTLEHMFVKAMTIFICLVSVPMVIGSGFLGWKCFNLSR